MGLEVLLDVLEMLLEVLDLSWRSWTCPGGPEDWVVISSFQKKKQAARSRNPEELQTC